MKEKLKFLIVDTSQENFTGVYFYKDGEEYIKSSSEDRGHIKNLMPLIRDILLENDSHIKDLDFISIVEGPGSWTGLRIGFSTVKVLCMINNLKMIVINNFDIFLRNFNNENNSTEIAILISSSNLNYYYRYILFGTSEHSDGISNEKTLVEKYPKIEKVIFKSPSEKYYFDEAIEKFQKNKFADVDRSEPYYISTGDIKSNFVKARL